MNIIRQYIAVAEIVQFKNKYNTHMLDINYIYQILLHIVIYKLDKPRH